MNFIGKIQREGVKKKMEDVIDYNNNTFLKMCYKENTFQTDLFLLNEVHNMSQKVVCDL